MAVSIRPVVASDEPEWRRLFLAYIAFYEAEVADDVVGATFDRVLDGTFLGLLAVDEGGRPMGLAHVLIHPSTWSRSSYCYLEDLFVDPAARGAGIGRALIEAVYREADARVCSRTYWVTREDNATARALYDRLAVKSPFVQYRRD